MITQDVNALGEAGATLAALLTPQGKILCDFILARAGEHFFIDAPSTLAGDLARRLKMYRLRAKADISERPDLAVIVAAAPQELVAHASFADPRAASLGWRGIIDRDGAPTEAAVVAAYHDRRIEAVAPEGGADFGPDEVFLTDVNFDILGGVCYRKGCFIGQEVTSRMKRKGGVRKRTVRLAFDGAPPAMGAAVTAGDSTLGEVLSGCPGAALALLRLDRLAAAQEAGAAILAGERPVRVAVPEAVKQG